MRIAVPHFRPPGKARAGTAKRQPRLGLTLLEVIIALAIFLFSLAVLSHLLSMSGDRALETNLRTQASFLCQSKLAELITGVESLKTSGYAPFQENPDWQWKSDCNESDIPGLWNVEVAVKRDRSGGGVLEVSLSQMVLNPSQRGSTLDAPTSSGGTP